MGIQITKRDIEILRFINLFGLCEMSHIQKKFSLRHPRNYQILNRLIKMELVKHDRLFRFRQGIYRLTERGAKFTSLPPLFKIPLATYDHSLCVIDVYLKLSAQYPEATFLSERHLIHDKHLSGVGQSGHLSDGLLIFPDNKQVAIEIELTIKSKKRLEDIFKKYSANFEIQEVWYFCTEHVADYLKKLVATSSLIKIFLLDEMTDYETTKPECF